MGPNERRRCIPMWLKWEGGAKAWRPTKYFAVEPPWTALFGSEAHPRFRSFGAILQANGVLGCRQSQTRSMPCWPCGCKAACLAASSDRPGRAVAVPLSLPGGFVRIYPKSTQNECGTLFPPREGRAASSCRCGALGSALESALGSALRLRLPFVCGCSCMPSARVAALLAGIGPFRRLLSCRGQSPLWVCTPKTPSPSRAARG